MGHTPAFKGRSGSFGAAMSRSAERRRCPKCQRKSAIVRLSIVDDEFVAAYCRWDDCDYARLRRDAYETEVGT